MGILYCLYKKDFSKDIVQIYIKEVFLRYEVPAKIILNRDIRFILAF